MRQAALVTMLAAAGVALHAMPAAAALVARTFVSGTGMDTNPCSRTAPCRSFGQAIGQTSAGGEIVVLDSAGYGPFTIDKAITVSADGVEAAITTTTRVNGVTIAAGASDAVNLSGLTLTGGGVGINGIAFTSGGTLNIQNCSVRGFTNEGLSLFPGAAQITVSDTIVANNTNDGIHFAPSANAAVFFERVQAIGNGTGFNIDGQAASAGVAVKAIAANSVATGNGNGFAVSTHFGASPTFMVVNSQAFKNGFGLVAIGSGGAAQMIIANTKVYGSTTDGFFIELSGTITTFANNYIADTTNSGSLTALGQQ